MHKKPNCKSVMVEVNTGCFKKITPKSSCHISKIKNKNNRNYKTRIKL